MILAAVSFLLLIVLPVDFSYSWFALILLLTGIGMGLFSAPNSAGVMNSLPPAQRGAGAGMQSPRSSVLSAPMVVVVRSPRRSRSATVDEPPRVVCFGHASNH